MRKLLAPTVALFAVIALAITSTALGANPKSKPAMTPEAQCLKLFDDQKILKNFRAASAALKDDKMQPEVICLALHGGVTKIQPWVSRRCLVNLADGLLLWNWRAAAKAVGSKPSRLCQVVKQYLLDDNGL